MIESHTRREKNRNINDKHRESYKEHNMLFVEVNALIYK